MLSLPEKISPCPISEAIVEVRFDSPFPPDAIYGVVYNEFKEDFPSAKNLPILQIPEPIRSQDPALLYKPYYKLTNSGFVFNIGPKLCGLISQKEYAGWTLFSKKIKDCFERIFDLEIIEKVTRIGIRYINFFENRDILEKVNLKLIMNSKPFKSDETILRTVIKADKFICNLQISNKAKLKQNNDMHTGSIIDIDVITDDISQENPKTEIITLIEEGHHKEKELFFTLLDKEFIKTLNPEYKK